MYRKLEISWGSLRYVPSKGGMSEWWVLLFTLTQGPILHWNRLLHPWMQRQDPLHPLNSKSKKESKGGQRVSGAKWKRSHLCLQFLRSSLVRHGNGWKGTVRDCPKGTVQKEHILGLFLNQQLFRERHHSWREDGLDHSNAQAVHVFVQLPFHLLSFTVLLSI